MIRPVALCVPCIVLSLQPDIGKEGSFLCIEGIYPGKGCLRVFTSAGECKGSGPEFAQEIPPASFPIRSRKEHYAVLCDFLCVNVCIWSDGDDHPRGVYLIIRILRACNQRLCRMCVGKGVFVNQPLAVPVPKSPHKVPVSLLFRCKSQFPVLSPAYMIVVCHNSKQRQKPAHLIYADKIGRALILLSVPVRVSLCNGHKRLMQPLQRLREGHTQCLKPGCIQPKPDLALMKIDKGQCRNTRILQRNLSLPVRMFRKQFREIGHIGLNQRLKVKNCPGIKKLTLLFPAEIGLEKKICLTLSSFETFQKCRILLLIRNGMSGNLNAGQRLHALKKGIGFPDAPHRFRIIAGGNQGICQSKYRQQQCKSKGSNKTLHCRVLQNQDRCRRRVTFPIPSVRRTRSESFIPNRYKLAVNRAA